MAVLLIDLGNTALKWTTDDCVEDPKTYVHQGLDTLPADLYETWLKLEPVHVVGSMVSTEFLALSMTKFFNKHRIAWDWLHSEEIFKGAFTLINRYGNVRQLGSDRWHAAIGATSLFPGNALLICQMGTATTIDTVLPNDGRYEFLGGRILPGPTMMQNALIQNTRCRPGNDGKMTPSPNNTTDAIMTGIIESHLGVISCAVREIRQKGFVPKIVLAGGAAPCLAPFIQEQYPEAVLKHNLVLRGLSLRAQEKKGS